MVIVEELRDYVGASVSDDAFLGTVLLTAQDMVWAYVGDSTVPDTVLDLAVMQVASELFHRRNAPNGVAQFAALDGTPVRVARDPMTSTYPLLNKFVLGGV
jgi:hypothetical protein